MQRSRRAPRTKGTGANSHRFEPVTVGDGTGLQADAPGHIAAQDSGSAPPNAAAAVLRTAASPGELVPVRSMTNTRVCTWHIWGCRCSSQWPRSAAPQRSRTSSTGPLPLATLGSVHPPPRVNAFDVTLLAFPVRDSTRTGSETSHQQPPRSASKIGPQAVYRAWTDASGRIE